MSENKFNAQAEKERIKQLLSSYNTPEEEIFPLLSAKSAATRQKAEKYLQKKQAEEERLHQLYNYERELYAQGYQLIAGLDEAGRGPVCGPVVAAACILPPEFKLWGVNDSKKLSEAARLELEREIKDKALFWAVAGVNHRKIDEINILQATFLAMRKSISRLGITPDYLLLDAVKLPECDIPQQAIIKGDAKSASIAAASILAKTHRDRIMDKYAQMYPQYGIAKHKGYPTAEHIKAIDEFGWSPIHRRSFHIKKQVQNG